MGRRRGSRGQTIVALFKATPKKKGRQGRSKAVRAIKELERQMLESLRAQNPNPVRNDWPCRGCHKSLFETSTEDCSTGDTICTECGTVSQSTAPFEQTLFQVAFNGSKPYERAIHYQQRIAQATCRDPLLSNRVLLMIADYIWKHGDELGPPSLFGPKTFKLISNQCQPRLPSRTPRHWIQIRKRLNVGTTRGRILHVTRGVYDMDDPLQRQDYYCDLENEDEDEPLPQLTEEEEFEEEILEAVSFDTIPWEVVLEYETARRLKLRYKFVSQAFDAVIKNHESPAIRRKNIINLNYTMVQLFRLEDESLFQLYGRFFPQLTGSKQAPINNRRWQLIIEYCRQNFGAHTNPVTGQIITFNWEYKPLETRDIIWYCTFFR